MPKITKKKLVEVCFSPNLYSLHKGEAEIVVVIDVLRATSAICTAFHYGVKSIIPISTLEEAFSYKKKGFLVAAERDGHIVEGFKFGNSPHAYMTPEIKGKTIVMTTTNGTKTINVAKDAGKVVIGSFLNMNALGEYLIKQNKNTLLLCSGWKNKFNLEDSICAGAIADQLHTSLKFESHEDASVAAKYLFHSARENYMKFLKASSHRRRLKHLNLNEDIKYCLTPNQTNVVPVLKGDKLVKA
ncbi:MAG: 2-phosphosulfolactate phosphatase [Flavobacteriales bacterium]